MGSARVPSRSSPDDAGRSTGAAGAFPAGALRVPQDVQVRQVPPLLLEVEPVADEELVRHGEADVPHREVVHQPPVRAVEERRGRERPRPAELEGADEVVQRQARVDHVLDDDDVAAVDAGVEVLQEADPAVAAGLGVRAVPGELDEVEGVGDLRRAREVGDEDDARLQRRDEDRLVVRVVARELGTQLAYARRNLLRGEVDLADPRIELQEASFRPYRCARRSMSRR